MSFLSPPNNIEEALNRLPAKDHPLTVGNNVDFEMAWLRDCRVIIQEAILLGPKDVELGSRIVDLELGEYKLMEQRSFHRDDSNKLVFGWVKIPDDSKWAYHLHDVEKKDPFYYAYWTISGVLPREISQPLPGEGIDCHLVFIESDTSFNFKRSDFSPIKEGSIKRMLAVLSTEELIDLIENLGGQESCEEGNVEMFVEQSSSIRQERF